MSAVFARQGSLPDFLISVALLPGTKCLETGIGVVKSPKIRGGGENFELSRARLKLTPFYSDSTENRQFGGQKSKSSSDNFRGEFPPPSSVRYVLTPPPYPGLRDVLFPSTNRLVEHAELIRHFAAARV